MKVRIEPLNTPDIWRLPANNAVKLRIYANQSFITGDGQFIGQGTPGQANSLYLEVDCNLTAHILLIPEIEIDSTVDGLDSAWATYTAELVAGGMRVPFLANFPVNTLQVGDPSTTWGEIILLRNMVEPQTLTESLSRQINGMISLAVGNLNKATAGNYGVTRLTFPPDDPTDPEAVASNDPDYLSLLATVASTSSFTFGATDLWDNGYWVAQTGFNRHSPQARAVFITEATSVDIGVHANFVPDAGTAIQVWVNGSVHASPGLAFASGAQTLTQALPAGLKLVEIVGGVQALVAGTVLGTFLKSAVFNAVATMLPPQAHDRIVAVGDSTFQGGGGGSTGKNIDTAMPTQFRQLSTRSIVVEAHSGKSLWDETNTAGLRAAFVAKLVAMKPAAIWFLIGVNDYQANVWSAASFGTAYAATIDDLHAALPNIKIYCQTPLLKFTEAANGLGNTLEDYRQQIRNLTASRGTWAILTEGVAVLSQAEMLSEGGIYIHPNDLGNRNLALFIDTVLSGTDPTAMRADLGLTEDVVWTNTANVAVAGNSLTKNAGIDGSPDAGGFSTKSVIGNGPWRVRWTLTEIDKTRLLGVSSTSTGLNLSDIRYGFAPQATGTLALWQDGVGYTSGTPVILAGDQLQLRSDGASVYYERIRGGVVTIIRKAATPLTPTMYPLFVQAIILGSAGTVTNVKIHGLLS